MNLDDKIFIEKRERTRLIIEQGIGDKVFDELKKKYNVRIFRNNFSNEKIVFIEYKEEDDS